MLRYETWPSPRFFQVGGKFLGLGRKNYRLVSQGYPRCRIHPQDNKEHIANQSRAAASFNEVAPGTPALPNHNARSPVTAAQGQFWDLGDTPGSRRAGSVPQQLR